MAATTDSDALFTEFDAIVEEHLEIILKYLGKFKDVNSDDEKEAVIEMLQQDHNSFIIKNDQRIQTLLENMEHHTWGKDDIDNAIKSMNFLRTIHPMHFINDAAHLEEILQYIEVVKIRD